MPFQVYNVVKSLSFYKANSLDSVYGRQNPLEMLVMYLGVL